MSTKEQVGGEAKTEEERDPPEGKEKLAETK